MLSVVGREARIIQAHICPYELRLKVRYSQLVDFTFPHPSERDIFLRWLFSDPVPETKPIEDIEEQPISPAGDTAPQVTAFMATSLQAGRCGGKLWKDFEGMSMGAMIPVA